MKRVVSPRSPTATKRLTSRIPESTMQSPTAQKKTTSRIPESTMQSPTAQKKTTSRIPESTMQSPTARKATSRLYESAIQPPTATRKATRTHESVTQSPTAQKQATSRLYDIGLLSPERKQRTAVKVKNSPESVKSSQMDLRSEVTNSELSPDLTGKADLCMSLLVDLRMNIVELPEVLDAILDWIFDAPIAMHKYEIVCGMLNGSDDLAPDIGYILVAFAMLILKEGIKPSTDFKKLLISHTERLIKEKRFVTLGKEQMKVRRNLRLFLDVLKSLKLSALKDTDGDHFGIDVINKYTALKVGKDATEVRTWPTKARQELIFEPDDSGTFCDESDIPNPSLLSQTSPRKMEISSDQIANINEENPWNITPPTSEIGKHLVSLFTDWPSAYGATQEVWKALNTHDDFDLDEVVQGLPPLFAAFLTEAIKTYMDT